MNKEFKKYITKELNKADEYTLKVFEYLKELEEETKGYSDKKLQKAIYQLCETGEIISKLIIELEASENNE